MKVGRVAILMGSDSDWNTVKAAAKVLAQFGVPWEARVMSAHRTPERVAAFVRGAERRGICVILAAAGGAAHLAGVVASHTTLPVIGIPIEGGALHGLDALLAMVQMPAGIPVPTVTLGSAGPINAALFAVAVLALQNRDLATRLKTYREELQAKVAVADRRVRAEAAKVET